MDKDAAHVNNPALVNTSDQPSFFSANFSPFTSAEALRPSDIRPVPSLNLQPNTRGGTEKKISNSPYRKFVQATQEKKIKQSTKSKTIRLASNVLLGPSRRQKRGFAGIQIRPTLHKIRTLTQLFLSLTIPWKKRNKTLIVCSVLVVCLNTTMEKSQHNVRNIADRRTHCALVWRKILFVSLFRDKYCFALSLYPLHLYFFYSLTILISVQIIHLPKLGTRVRLIRGYEAFKETNFTRVFLFQI